MNPDEVLEIVEKVLLSRQLSPIESLILRQSWIGQSYLQMAQDSAYGIPHIKEIGSQLWHDLSEVLGQKVTKKNLYLLLNQYRQNLAGSQRSIAPQEFPVDKVAGANFLPSATQVPEFPSGPVPLNSPLYIDRSPIEDLVCTEITKPGCVIRIKAPRKMGKSSLLSRILARAQAFAYKTVYLDFQEADEAVFTSLDKFLRWFCANISRQLHLNPLLEDYWDEDMGSKVSCKIYFEGYVLEQIDSPLVIALNEVNRVFEHPKIAQDFLPMLRYWHEQARVVENWQKLRLVVVHTTEIYIPLKINQSPFNVGLSISLPQFTSKQVQDLAVRYGLDWTDTKKAQQLMAMVGGHPYLASIALYHLCRGDMTLEELLQTAPTPSGIYNHHLLSHLTMLQDEPQLISALQQVVTAEDSVVLEAIAAYKLESIGLIQLDGNQAKPSCELYRLYFRQQLEQENWIDASLEQLEPEKQNDQYSYEVDELTQLASRRYFNSYLETHWQQWAKEILPLSLILCDIDYFRFYNNAHGFPAGDACLQQIANAILDSTSHQASVVARYGGEEFAVILPQTEAAAAVDVAEKIRVSVKALAIALDQPGIGGFPDEVLTVSLGVASMTPSSKTSSAILISAALEALSTAKKQGRDCVSV